MSDRYDTSNLSEHQNGEVLPNLRGITQKVELDHVEEARFERLMEEALRRYSTDHRFTAKDILWLHKFWLEGVFAWAGAYRTVNLGKGGFMFAAAAYIPELMRQFEKDQLTRLTPCRAKPAADIAAALAEVHVELVLIHPFREGNGRIARLVSVLMALQAGLPPLNFSELRGKKREEYFAAVRAGLDRDYEPMRKIFAEVIDLTLEGARQ